MTGYPILDQICFNKGGKTFTKRELRWVASIAFYLALHTLRRIVEGFFLIILTLTFSAPITYFYHPKIFKEKKNNAKADIKQLSPKKDLRSVDEN